MAVALVVAAGSGERLGAGRPKAFAATGGHEERDRHLPIRARGAYEAAASFSERWRRSSR